MIGSIIPEICNNLKSNNYVNPGEATTESHEDLTIKTTLFELFINLSKLLETGIKISATDGPNFKLRNFHQWFTVGVTHWLHMSSSKAKIRWDLINRG
jgi:BAI1-associated protein 3